MIGIIDYGLGNISAFQEIIKKLNLEYKIIFTKDDLANIEKVIMPGVGSFDWAISRLKDADLFDSINSFVLSGKPILGICVGMQIMAASSEEGQMNGFGWIDGRVKRLLTKQTPHMGWNTIDHEKQCPLFEGIQARSEFYFLHSYALDSNTGSMTTFSNYSEKFCSSFRLKNIFGVQFHPEKSHNNGIQVIKNFCCKV